MTATAIRQVPGQLMPPVSRYGDMVATLRDTECVIVEGLLTSDECDTLIERTTGRTTELRGPGVSDTPIVAPHGLHYPKWNWHCVVHTHPVDDLEELHGIDTRLWALFHHVNRLLGWNIPLEVAKFGISHYPTGDRMGTHVDDEGRKEPPWDLAHRGVSMSVSLSEPGTYEGGQLRVYNGQQWITPLAGLPRGTAVVFGSSTLHEVTQVTAGERWVLLAWLYNNHYMSRLR